MHRLAICSTVSVLALGVALAACGGDETTTTETQTETATEQTQTGTETGQTTTATATQTTTGSQTLADCTSDQVLSQSSGTCVDIRQGNNPCPEGEVPMADRPVCVPKD